MLLFAKKIFVILQDDTVSTSFNRHKNNVYSNTFSEKKLTP